MRRAGLMIRIAAPGAALFLALGCAETDKLLAPPAVKGVAVGASGFLPPALVVVQGDSVVWTWDAGNVQHNVTFETGGASSNQSTGVYGRRFPTTGVQRYRCTFHSADFSTGMVGSVDVRAGNPASGYLVR